MSYFPPQVDRRSREPKNAGASSAANARGTSASFVCGCFVRVSLRIEVQTRIISEARFQTNGCGFMAAAADIICEGLSGRDLTELHAVPESEFTELVTFEAGGLPAGRNHCVTVVLEAVRAALADHRASLIEEFRGERALICTCFGVSEETIEQFIAAFDPGSVDEVTSACRAGGGCGSCRMLIQEMLDVQTMGR